VLTVVHAVNGTGPPKRRQRLERGNPSSIAAATTRRRRTYGPIIAYDDTKGCFTQKIPSGSPGDEPLWVRHFAEFSADRLVRMLLRLDSDVTVTIHRPPVLASLPILPGECARAVSYHAS
jgi:hypothetical protein